ncbi:MAG: hypothetical protein JNM93_12350 [Bacteriovoracaceae bacterium]|nr:hypothetical protein [Bacteriovoracaceae bacterium]
MQKNWLIRTKDNHIWGPVTKDKILELYQNGTIKLEDEICSGNGYWFHIKEKELVDRFLLKEEMQGFNPLSTYDDDSEPTLEIESLPTPVAEKHSTQVINLKELEASGSFNVEEAKKPEEAVAAPEQEEVVTTGESVEKKNETFSIISEEKIEPDAVPEEVAAAPVSTETIPITDFGNKKELSDILLLVLAAILLVVAVLAFNNRNLLIKTFLEQKFSFNSAHAQEGSEHLVKKKEFLFLSRSNLKVTS